MTRALLLVTMILFALATTTPADASINAKKTKLQTTQTTINLLAVPIQLFVSISQKPVLVMSKSLTQILKQALLGHKKTHGMPFDKASRARI